MYQETRDLEQIKFWFKKDVPQYNSGFLEVCSLFSDLIIVSPVYFTCLKSTEILLHVSQLYFLTWLLGHLMFPTFVFSSSLFGNLLKYLFPSFA